MIGSAVVDDVLVQAARLGRSRRQGDESITTIDIEKLANRAYPMRRVDVAVSRH